MVIKSDNRDLMIRRKRAHLTGEAVAEILGITDKNAIYHFEAGRRGLPHGLTRKDYERVLDEAEKRARKSA